MFFSINLNLASLFSQGKIIRIVCFLFTALIISGCSIMPSHIHSSDRLVAAEKVQNELNSYAENAPAMYKTMIINLEKFKIEEEKVISDLIVNREEALINQLPTLKSNLLQIKIDGKGIEEKDCKKKDGSKDDACKGINEKIKEFDDFIFEETKNYLVNKKILSENLKDAKAAVQKLQKAVDSAKTDVTNWNASIALLKEGISGLMSESNTEKQQSVDEILKKIGDREVEFIDNGKLVKEKIKKILENRLLPKNKKNLESLGIPDTPGSTLIILKLGLVFAEIEKDEAESRMTQLTSRAELFEDMHGGTKLAEQLITDIGETFKTLQSNETVERYLMNLSFDARSQYRLLNNLKNSKNPSYNNIVRDLKSEQLIIAKILENIRYLYLADLIITRANELYKLSSARLNHKESILSAQIEDRRYLALLGSGSDSLVMFERGGVTREDVADIINIAQAIAVAVLAGRI